MVNLSSLLAHISIPVSLLNQEGECCGGNAQGLQFYDRLFLIIEGLEAGCYVNQKDLLVQCQQQNFPTWFTTEEILFKVSPLACPVNTLDKPVTALIEWFVDGGLRSGKEKLQMIQDVSQAVNSSLILEDIFDALGEVLHQYIPFETTYIVILDNTQNSIKMLVKMLDDGFLEITGENNSFAGYEPLVDYILKNPYPQFFLQGKAPPSALIPEHSTSVLVVPLVNKGMVIGLIAMSTSTEAGFYHYQQELLTEVSAQLTVAVENAKLYWQTQSQASREFLINQLTRSIRQSLDIEVILATAVSELGKVIGISRCFIHYFAPDMPAMCFQYAMPGISNLRVEWSEYEKQIFLLRQQPSYNPFILNDVRDAPAPLKALAALHETEQVKSVAVFPVLIRDTLVGTIALHQCDAFRVWVAEDIALLRALAEHLGVALNQAQLFQTLERQKGTLEKTLQELQQAQLFLIQSEKMAVLGQFVAGIAHEVNTPLGTLMSNQDTLKSCLDKSRTLTTPLLALQKEDPDFQRQLQKLDTTMDSLLSLNTLAATRIAEIVKNLRNFARLDESELKVVDLHEGLESTLLLVKSSLHPKIGIIRCYQPRLPMVQCYPGLLNQVFMNLIVNASHAIQEAMETLNRTAGTITIETATVEGGSWIEICVTDTGKGIHPDNLGKVFDPGFTTKGVGVGTGLGLALCYQMVNKHHGTITVSSQHNEGACFTVRIPNRVGTM